MSSTMMTFTAEYARKRRCTTLMSLSLLRDKNDWGKEHCSLSGQEDLRSLIRLNPPHILRHTSDESRTFRHWSLLRALWAPRLTIWARQCLTWEWRTIFARGCCTGAHRCHFRRHRGMNWRPGVCSWTNKDSQGCLSHESPFFRHRRRSSRWRCGRLPRSYRQRARSRYQWSSEQVPCTRAPNWTCQLWERQSLAIHSLICHKLR